MSNTKLYQIIPNNICLTCDVCCRFLDSDSPLAPIFTQKEKNILISQGANPTMFRYKADGYSSQIKLKQHQDYYICPFFNTDSNKCTIYKQRPLDCQLYPFALMFNKDRSKVVLGVDMLCPYSEEHYETDMFQHHLLSVIDYVESDEVQKILITHWSLIGEYQDTVRIFHTLNQDFSYAAQSAHTE